MNEAIRRIKQRFEWQPSYEVWDWFHSLVLNNRDVEVLECGTENGGTFSAMASARPSKIECVDAWDILDGYGDTRGAFGRFKEVYALLEDMGCKNMKYTRGLFQSVVHSLGQYDIVFYDGCHNEKSVSEDIPIMIDRVCENGLLLVHDVSSPKCFESQWFWDIQNTYPSYRLGGRFGVGIVAPKGDIFMKRLVVQGLIPHFRLAGKIYEKSDL